MKSRTTRKFWQLFENLPQHAQERAREAYRRFQANPGHPGLQFKRVSSTQPVFSARVGIHYRVLGLVDGDTITWFWIGSHDDYERML